MSTHSSVCADVYTQMYNNPTAWKFPFCPGPGHLSETSATSSFSQFWQQGAPGLALIKFLTSFPISKLSAGQSHYCLLPTYHIIIAYYSIQQGFLSLEQSDVPTALMISSPAAKRCSSSRTQNIHTLLSKQHAHRPLCWSKEKCCIWVITYLRDGLWRRCIVLNLLC